MNPLAEAVGAGLGPAAVDLDLTPELLTLARSERVVSVLAAAAGTGALRVSDAAAHAELRHRHEHAMVQCLRLEQTLLLVAAELAAIGIEFRVLKGAAVARLDYPDPAWRSFGDVDILVRSSDYDAAVARLLTRGARRRSPEIRSGFDRRFGKGTCIIRPDGVQVDVHRLLATGPFGLTGRPDECFHGGEVFELAGVELVAPVRWLRFLHACEHAVLGDWPPRLAVLRDVAQLHPRTATEREQALDAARRWRAELVVARAVSAAADAFSLPDDALRSWARGCVGTRFERRALEAYVGPDRSYARQMAAALPALSWSDRAELVRTLLVPDRRYVDRHDGSYLRRARRAAGALRRAS